jgi:tRNA pseudouridine38-40 synthase
LGTHDFRSFSNLSREQAGTECTVWRADWDCWDSGFLFSIRADRYLYKMVRNLVGTVLREALAGGGGREAIASILLAGNRRLAAPPAPAFGLCLEAVGFEPPWPVGDEALS